MRSFTRVRASPINAALPQWFLMSAHARFTIVVIAIQKIYAVVTPGDLRGPLC
jgi:hypothetical protein